MSEDAKTAKLREIIEHSKQYISIGFGEIDGKFINASKLDIFLLAGARRAVGFVDAILILCKSGHSEEAAILTRSLIELGVNMRWILVANTDIRLDAFFDDLKKYEPGEAWAKDLRKRMKEIGMDEYFYKKTMKSLSGIVHTNASSLVYNSLAIDAPSSMMSESAVLVLVAQMMGHVLFALNEHYVNHFSHYDELWDYIKRMEDFPEYPFDLIPE